MTKQASAVRAVRLVATELVRSPEVGGTRIRCPEDAGHLIASFIGNKDREHFVAVHLSAQCQVLSMEIVSIGDQSSAPVHPRETFKAAILMNASSIIVGHNHPSGDITPSPEDRAMNQVLVDVGKLIAIPVIDFVIVAGDRWRSITSEP